MRRIVRSLLASGLVVGTFIGTARADLLLSGPTANAGSYSTAALSSAATPADTVNIGGFTGITLWGLLGGANAANANSPIYGAITTSTPSGYNGKNSILRYFLRASGAGGQTSVVSLGEIDPNFGGTASNSANPAFVAFQATGGSLLATPVLVVPNATGRNVSNLTGLQLLAVPALPSGGSGVSRSVQLSGDVNAPGTYTQTDMQNDFTPVTLNIPGATYTGIPLWTFLNPSDNNSLDQIVIT